MMNIITLQAILMMEILTMMVYLMGWRLTAMGQIHSGQTQMRTEMDGTGSRIAKMMTRKGLHCLQNPWMTKTMTAMTK